MKIAYTRWAVLAAVFLIITIGLVLNTDLGTLSSFGWQAIATICPLGVVESSLAAKTIFPRALIVLVATVVFVVIFGKVFCAWICPVAPIRSLKEQILRQFAAATKSSKADKSTGAAESIRSGESVKSETDQLLTSDSIAEACNKDCSSCASKRAKLDSRHLILGGSLLSAVLFGFPVFCLLCPIGLIFGTVIVLWQFFNLGDASLTLLIYPPLLIIELVVLRKWCSRFCPMGALLSLLSLPNRFLKPVVNRNKCLRANGGSCNTCADVCGEQLDPHYDSGMNECTKCGVCKDKCPAQAISFVLLPRQDAYVSDTTGMGLGVKSADQ